VKVVILHIPPEHDEAAEGFTHAVEVQSSTGEVANRWTFRSQQHAERERNRIVSWFHIPEERGGRPVIC
jgi:hypothetical protein